MEECPHTDCVYNKNCAIMGITKKVPKKDEKCSYYAKEVVKKVSAKKTEESE